MSSSRISAIAHRFMKKRQHEEEVRKKIEAQNLQFAVTASLKAMNNPKPQNKKLIPIPLSSLIPLKYNYRILHWGDTRPCSRESDIPIDPGVKFLEDRKESEFPPDKTTRDQVTLSQTERLSVSIQTEIDEATRMLNEGRKLLGIDIENKELKNFKFETYKPGSLLRNRPMKVLPNRNTGFSSAADSSSTFSSRATTSSESELSNVGVDWEEYRKVLPGRTHIQQKGPRVDMEDCMENYITSRNRDYQSRRILNIRTLPRFSNIVERHESTFEESVCSRTGSRKVLSPLNENGFRSASSTPPSTTSTASSKPPTPVGAGDRILSSHPSTEYFATQKTIGNKKFYLSHSPPSFQLRSRTNSVEKRESFFLRPSKPLPPPTNQGHGAGGEGGDHQDNQPQLR